MLPQFRNFKVVPQMMFAPGAVTRVRSLAGLSGSDQPCAILIDKFFEDGRLAQRMGAHTDDAVFYVDTVHEPTTVQIDEMCERIRAALPGGPSAVVGVGGGIVMDVAKAVAVMLNNPGKAEQYQGWDRVKRKAVYKIGVPTISGTGSEVSRTTVLTGPTRKQGINSDFSLFDQIVLDPELLATVPRTQRFFTGMDCYIHCVESLCGSFINDFARAFATKALDMCEDVFLKEGSDADLMMASLMGGVSIVYSEVGVCHSLSYGLSYGLGYHHGEANCIVFNQLQDYYPQHVEVFKAMLDRHEIELPRNVMARVTDDTRERMIDVALTMERALHHALGAEWRVKFSRERIKDLYARM